MLKDQETHILKKGYLFWSSYLDEKNKNKLLIKYQIVSLCIIFLVKRKNKY